MERAALKMFIIDGGELQGRSRIRSGFSFVWCKMVWVLLAFYRGSSRFQGKYSEFPKRKRADVMAPLPQKY